MIFHGHHHRGHMRQTHFREARDLAAPDVKRRRSCLRLHLATGRSENRQAYPSITCTLFNQMQELQLKSFLQARPGTRHVATAPASTCTRSRLAQVTGMTNREVAEQLPQLLPPVKKT